MWPFLCVQLAFAACSGWAQTGNMVVGSELLDSRAFPGCPWTGDHASRRGDRRGPNPNCQSPGHTASHNTRDISVTFRQTASVPIPQSAALPLLEVDPRVSTCRDQPFYTGNCGRLAAITLQIPYEMNPNFPRLRPNRERGLPGCLRGWRRCWNFRIGTGI